LKTLQGYIKSELNIHNLVFSSDEEQCGIKYRIAADWPTLGRKLRKNLNSLKSVLPSLPSDTAKMYLKEGHLEVHGFHFDAGDLLVTPYADHPSSGQYATNSDSDSNVVVLLDIQIYEDLHDQWLARELINRVQKLRKKADLQATDEVELFYSASEEHLVAIDRMVSTQHDTLKRSLRCIPIRTPNDFAEVGVLVAEEQKIAELKFMLSVVRL
jgi:isoleucyl-tRNA synthetase